MTHREWGMWEIHFLSFLTDFTIKTMSFLFGYTVNSSDNCSVVAFLSKWLLVLNSTVLTTATVAWNLISIQAATTLEQKIQVCMLISHIPHLPYTPVFSNPWMPRTVPTHCLTHFYRKQRNCSCVYGHIYVCGTSHCTSHPSIKHQ